MGVPLELLHQNNPRGIQLEANPENSIGIIMAETLMHKTILRGLICVFRTMEVTR
jgi:hypothetical protein